MAQLGFIINREKSLSLDSNQNFAQRTVTIVLFYTVLCSVAARVKQQIKIKFDPLLHIQVTTIFFWTWRYRVTHIKYL